MIDARTVDHARAANIEDVAARHGLRLCGRGVERFGPCPICGGTDRFAINKAKQIFVCRNCATGGDVIALVMFLRGCSFPEAVAELTGGTQAVQRVRPQPIENRKPKPSSCQPFALQLWNEAGNPRGTLAQTYLRRRGLTLLDGLCSRVLRFHRSCPWTEPETGDRLRVTAMLALFRGIVSNEPVAIQRTRLKPDGSKHSRLSLGPTGGAAIKIDPDGDISDQLCIAEGLETALSARALGYGPVWAVGNAGAIKAFPVLAGIAALTLCAEDDKTGANRRAIAETSARYRAADVEVFELEPLAGGDINDAIRRLGTVHEGQRPVA